MKGVGRISQNNCIRDILPNFTMKIELDAQLVASGEGFCHGIKLGFDDPWEIYVITNDMYKAYFRIHINHRCVKITSSETAAFEYLKGYNGAATSEFTLDYFSNDKLKILKVISENQITVNDEFYAPLSQKEISDLAHFAYIKTHRLINELIENGFIACCNNKRSQYTVTRKGTKALVLMQQTHS